MPDPDAAAGNCGGFFISQFSLAQRGVGSNDSRHPDGAQATNQLPSALGLDDVYSFRNRFPGKDGVSLPKLPEAFHFITPAKRRRMGRRAPHHTRPSGQKVGARPPHNDFIHGYKNAKSACFLDCSFKLGGWTVIQANAFAMGRLDHLLHGLYRVIHCRHVPQ